MKTLLRINGWAALGGLALATPTFAQTEQWLEYHSGVSEARGYRWLELTTNAPPGIALPKLHAAPRFARWTTPMDPSGGRWLCLDRTGKSGLYDRLFLDVNGSGRLDDKAAVEAPRSSENVVETGPVRITFKGEDGPVAYHLTFRFYQFNGDDERLLVQSAGWYAGMVKIGDRKRQVELIDGNVNGAFNDQGLNASECDRIRVEGDKADQRYLGRLLEIDGQLYRFEAARDGAFVKLQKAEGIQVGQVRVPDTITEFTAIGPNGHFVRQPVKGEFALPAGKYRIHGWQINRRDDHGAAWSLSGYSFNELADFTVAAENPVTLDIGEPVRTALQAARTPSGEMTYSLRFQGKLGESIQMLRGNELPRGPRLTLASLAGAWRGTNSFEFG
jgi:hypothetical protein